MTMDYLMKGVPTVLKWSPAAGERDVKAEELEKAVSLLVLRCDLLRIIDGAEPSNEYYKTNELPSQKKSEKRIH
jgi:hypothetical protein